MKAAKAAFAGHNTGGGGGATRTVAVERQLKPLEKRNIDTVLDVTGAVGGETAVSPIASLVNCIPGPLATNRLGRKILVKSVFVRGRVTVGTGMTGVAFFRMIIVQDREPNGSVPEIAKVMATDEIFGLMNLGNGQRYKVLAEINLGGIGLSTDSCEGMLFERYIKTNILISYVDGAGAGTAADILANGIYAITYLGGDSSAVGAVTLKGNARVRFIDQ